MSEEIQNNASTVDQEEAIEPTETQETTNTPFEELPETWQNEIKKLRDEAAKHRQKAKTAAESAKTDLESKMREEFTNRESELTSRIEELNGQYESAMFRADEAERSKNKLFLAATHGIPKDKVDDFTKRLQGETEEELTKDAESLAELFVPSVKEDRSQGFGMSVPLNDSTLLRGLQDAVNKRR